MKYLRSILVIVFPTSLFFACNNPTNKAKENNATQTTVVDTAHTMPASTTNDIINKALSDTSVMPGDKSESDQNVHADSLFSQLKGFTSKLGKGDSGLLKNPVTRFVAPRIGITKIGS